MIKRAFFLAFCLVLTACASTSTSVLPTIDQVQYRIGPGDSVALTVFREEDLSGEYRVSEAGIISVPLAGDVDANGKTVSELRAALVAALSEGYVRDPQVTLTVTDYRPVYVLGEVQRPGEYEFSERMTVFALVAKAGGFTYRADEKIAYIRHEDESVERAYTLTSGGAVRPGDTVRFVERYF